MCSEKYNLSFTTGGLFHRESVILAEMWCVLGSWDSVRNTVLEKNILQARTQSSLKRVCREIASRLMMLNTSELDFFYKGSHQEQAYFLWIAICRRYKFIADFAVEVLRERYITLKSDLPHENFDSFFNQKSEWHLELDEITPATRAKLRQVLFKMLREADLLTANNMIHAALLTPRMVELIHQGSRREILYFPVFDSDVKGMKQ